MNKLIQTDKILSVIIPHYNSLDSLVILLKSLPDITQIEVIIVDDNSELEFDEIQRACIDIFRNTSVMVLKNELGKGAGVCRNIGIDHARGKWCLFADSDDFFTNDAFSIIMNQVNSDSDVIYFKPTSLDLKTMRKGTRHRSYEKLVQSYIDNSNRITELKIRSSFFVPWSKMVRHELIEKNHIRFDNTIVANDVMFSTKVGMIAPQIEVRNDSIYCVTQGDNTLTTIVNAERLEVRAKVYCNYYNYLKSMLNRKEFKMVVDNYSYSFLYQCVRRGLGIKELIRLYNVFKSNDVPIDYILMIKQFIHHFH